MSYIKINDEPIEIQTNRYDYNYDNEAYVEEIEYFTFNNQIFFLDRFVRIKNNAWVSNPEDYPDYVDAYYLDSYYFPLYLQLVNCNYVNLYTFKEDSLA